MPMFVTFYSFKGGVGRTLALANVATLLAADHKEPCRVLVWDFDLAAPGLQQVLNCKWKGKTREGFLDYVHNFRTKAKIEPIDKYICKTDIAGVDILPAGWMGRHYAAKLDEIHWQEIYREARGYQFMEATKKQMADIKPEYEYVLIDSLTGYSDVGGICVNQLADAVVLLFRLNRQNVEGISKVYQSIQKARKGGARAVKTLPVISPAWPFASPEANQWVDKVGKVFSDEWPLTIAFDGSLSFGEKIISLHQTRHPMSPKILDDYKNLTRALRRLNPLDTQTLFESIRELQGQDRFSEAFDASVKLVEKRPNRSAYWEQLVNTILLSGRSGEQDKLEEKAKGVVDQACLRRNPLAFVARYQLRTILKTKWEDALKDLNEALEIDPNQLDVYFLRGNELKQRNKYHEAIDDFTTFLDRHRNDVAAVKWYIARAQCYSKIRENEKAVKDLRHAVKLRPKDEKLLLLLARMLYANHEHSEAGEVANKALELEPRYHRAHIFLAHVLCALGERGKAAEELRKAMDGGLFDPGDILDAAEAYLLVDPKETQRLLDLPQFSLRTIRPDPVHLLSALAAVLLDEQEVKEKSILSFMKLANKGRMLQWSFDELKEFLEWGVASGCITKENRASLISIIELFENAKPEEAQEGQS